MLRGFLRRFVLMGCMWVKGMPMHVLKKDLECVGRDAMGFTGHI